MADSVALVDTTGASAAVHSHAAHGHIPTWFRPGVAGDWWIIGDECFHFSHGTLVIVRAGVIQTAYPATQRHVENVLVSRLQRLGWRALFRAPKCGRSRVMAYFGIGEENVHGYEPAYAR